MTYSSFKLSYQISPIILTGGAAQNVPGGMIPIISLTQSSEFDTGLLSGGSDLDLDSYFAHFEPVAGSSLIDQEIGHYPFANQSVAANAVIMQPLRISMRMMTPVQTVDGYAAKLATITSLRETLAQHNANGGTYTIATPAYLYTNCVMLSFRDASSGDSAQAQNAWLLDFEQPLLTLEQAQAAENSLMGKISSGTQVHGDPPQWSSIDNTVGVPPSLAAGSIVPAASSTSGSGSAASLLTSALGILG